MKNLFLIIALFTIVSCHNNNSNKSNTSIQASDTLKNAEMKSLVNLEIDIKGMTCTGCENTINRSVTAVNGVENVKSSHSEGKAWVTFDSTKTDISNIIAAVDESGYEVAGFKKQE